MKNLNSRLFDFKNFLLSAWPLGDDLSQAVSVVTVSAPRFSTAITAGTS